MGLPMSNQDAKTLWRATGGGGGPDGTLDIAQLKADLAALEGGRFCHKILVAFVHVLSFFFH